MNRRSFFSILAALPFARFASALPAVKTEFKAVSPAGIVKEFVASQQKLYPDLFLFKNRSGQYAFQQYDPRSGNPTTEEACYLIYGKIGPSGEVGSLPRILPRTLKLSKFGDLHAVGIDIGHNSGLDQVGADLHKALGMLLSA